MKAWHEEDRGPDPGVWWWAVEHLGHPAFYLRTLLPGDFAPGRRPDARHVLQLDGFLAGSVARIVCGTCGQEPEGSELEPIERRTGDRGFLESMRAGGQPWREPTDPSTCWLCSVRGVAAACEVELEALAKRLGARVGSRAEGARVRVCAGCEAFASAGEGR